MRIKGRGALFLAATAVLVFMLLGQAPAEAREAVVKSGSGVNVRGGPGTGYDLVGSAAANERLPVLETSGEWVKVRLAGGRQGWVAGWLVEVRQAPAAPAQSTQAREAVVQKAVNIRSGPGTSHGLVGSEIGRASCRERV